MSEIHLSAKQTIIFDDIMAWMKTRVQFYVLAGYAGTGKTTMASRIAEELGHNNVIFCAYTGKAANVLREKGMKSASTIHSYLYSPSNAGRSALEKIRKAIEVAETDKEKEALIRVLEMKRKESKEVSFKLDPSTDLKLAKLVIVDEYSMLDSKIRKDLEKNCKKILYLGDPFQLPPVKGECDLQPDAFMTEIHRQALDNPIIRYSCDVREGRKLQYCKEEGFSYMSRLEAAPELFTEADQVIVGKNKTRVNFNKRFREIKGYDKHPFPRKGEKVICLKNNHEMGLYNGMIETVKKHSKSIDDFFYLEIGRKIRVWKGDIEGRSQEYDYQNKVMRGLERFDFAYAITCHKSQGSEFDNVLVYNEPIGWGIERQRWLYTALTRGKKQVNLVDPD